METYTRYTYYLKKGNDNFVAERPSTEAADGLVAVTLYGYEASYLLENWKKYYWDASGDFTAPEGLPSHSEAVLRMKVADLTNVNEEQADTIASQTTTIESLKDIAAQLGGAQAMASVDLEGVKAATSELGGQLAEMMVAKTTTAE